MPCPRSRERAAHREFSAADLTRVAPPGQIGRNVLAFSTVHSTNSHLLDNAGDLPHGSVAIAESQTGGRGRLGRTWESPRGASVLLSVLLHVPSDSQLLRHGATVASLAACEAIRAATHCDCRVRWPNDLIIVQRKVGGVLVESRGLSSDESAARSAPPRRAVVIGVGINCLQHRGHFAGELAEKATSLEIESPHPIDRIRVAQCLLERLDNHIAACVSPHYLTGALAAWRSLTNDIGGRVTLRHDNEEFVGTILDIDDAGDLIVQLDIGGRRHFGAATTTRQW
ncbi:MAG: biotin--[acetyl-CoA-carboxylase] ligase [Phycisphaerales bacterium]|nr:biotin--[acetyl-CoA-carboxylase] ligase [Phycisphaerales bacterium]